MARGFLHEGAWRRPADNEAPRRSKLVEIDVRIRRETEKAWGIASPHRPGDIIWIPKSQSEMEGDTDPSRRATITLEEWLVIEKKLESLVKSHG